MKIESSTINMQSEHAYTSFYEKEEKALVSLSSYQPAATLSFSSNSSYSIGLMDKVEEDEKNLKEQRRKQWAENIKERLKKQREEEEKQAQERQKTQGDTLNIQSPAQMKLEVLKKMLAALQRLNKELNSSGSIKNEMNQLRKDLRQIERGKVPESFSNTGNRSSGTTVHTSVGSISSAGSFGQMTWKRTKVESVFYGEAERTAYSATGIARTADGREITFGVDIEMSHAFCAKYEKLTKESYITTDPLIINLNSASATVTDQKFLFDLDGDGKKENISFAGEGSGFLALDKNGDGIINDGNELFGTKSGDGFADLAAYDQDHNGWIDESDDIFQQLKIWTKDKDGNDRLVSLKEADVGAIYLGKTETQFSLKDEETNRTNGIIRSTGIFLKESGGTGTIQHVDLAI